VLWNRAARRQVAHDHVSHQNRHPQATCVQLWVITLSNRALTKEPQSAGINRRASMSKARRNPVTDALPLRLPALISGSSPRKLFITGVMSRTLFVLNFWGLSRRISKCGVRTKKRQMTGAVRDAHALVMTLELRKHCWTAAASAAPRRFRPHENHRTFRSLARSKAVSRAPALPPQSKMLCEFESHDQRVRRLDCASPLALFVRTPQLRNPPFDRPQKSSAT